MTWDISAPGDLITIDSVNNTWYQRLYLQAEKFYRYGIQANVTVKLQDNSDNSAPLFNYYCSSESNFPSLGSDSLLNLEDALKDESQKIGSTTIDEESDQESFVFLDYEEKDIVELYEAAVNLPYWQMKIALINMMDINAKISAEEAKLMLIASKSDYPAIKSKVSALLDKEHFRSLILMMLFSSKESAEIILTELVDKPELEKLMEPVENENITFLKAISCSKIENEEVVLKLVSNINIKYTLRLIESAAELGNLALVKCVLNLVKEEKLQRRAVDIALLAAVDSEQDQVVKFLYENYKSFFINAIKNNNKIKESAKKQSSKGRISAEEIYKILFSFDEDIVLSSIRNLYRSNYHFSNYIGLDDIRNLYRNEPKFSDYEGLDGIQNLFKEDSDVDIQNRDNMQVKFFPTKGDGNCFFHAAFGDKTSNVYEAKEAAAMREEWHKFLSQFQSLDDPKMPKSLKDQLEKVFNFFLNNPKDLTNRSEAIKNLANKTNKAISKANKKVIKLKDRIIKKFFKDQHFRNQIYKIIKTAIKNRNIRSPGNIKNIPSIQDLLNNENQLRNDIQEDFHSCVLELEPDLDEKAHNFNAIKNSFFNDATLYKAYLNAIGTRGYFVFFEEIPILASLANTKIIVYDNNKRNSQIFEPKEELLGGYKSNKELWGIKKEVTIYHEGSHYSRANTEFSLFNPQPIENRKSKIVFSSIAGGVVGGILSYLVATSLLLNLWWMAVGIALGSVVGFAISYYLTEPQIENTFIKMQPECVTT
ncbi:hypothetical protein [Candidatus Mesenet endosymbiont of Phosphuga atrata]|uniref:hypothetical protein n=1 Tax=Candidatus Mesenet endosymbiont of Phosphuga atrata TaxID=3066221 RepID=UPI0030CB2264